MIYLPEHDSTPAESDDSGDPAGFDLSFDVEALEFAVEAERGSGVDLEAENRKLVEDTEEFFGPGGTLIAAAALEGRATEFRPQQLAMARAIGRALIGGRNLAVEAPTGVGKSFAYLAPLVFRSRYAGRPALVSTETINLQEQLIAKDIPLLRQLTGINFKAALAKGRGNYLCLRRKSLFYSDQHQSLLPSAALVLDLEKLEKWAVTTEDGERDSVDFRMDPALWPLVCSETGSCPGPKCSFYRECFYFKARKSWDLADIVVANHALFFTDLAMRSEGADSGLLPNYGALVIDEAHTVEDNAAEYLGLDLSRSGTLGLLNRLYNPEVARGLLMKSGSESLALRQVITGLRDEVYGFFAPFEKFLSEGTDRREGMDNGARRIHDCARFNDTLSQPLMVLHRLLGEFIDGQEEGTFRTELESYLERCRGLINGVKDFLAMALPDAVYYVENDRNSIVLKAAPLNVAELLNRILFNADFPVILSSATLTVRNSFNFFCDRVGFDNGDTLLLDSPFSRDQATLHIDRSMPEPNDPNYQKVLAERIPDYIEMTGGKAFVLFTSYANLRYCADHLRGYFAAKGITLLVQGEDMTRSAMLKTFREDIDSVLFGTDSFWTGVDVPGEALSNVIVTKLPFPSPGHPLAAARSEKIELGGGNSFRDYFLPSAVLKFRQGIGRLIRSRSDRGIIVLLDRRVISKGYGRNFLDSQPYPIAMM